MAAGTPSPSALSLEVAAGPDRGARLALSVGTVVVGRDPTCDLVLSDAKSSRRHAEITLLEDGQVFVRDLGSRNGTRLGGQVLGERAAWRPGQPLAIGDDVIVLAASARPAEVAVGAAPSAAPRTVDEQPHRAAPADVPGRSQSAVQRILLQRSVRRANLLAGLAVVASIVVVGVLVSGVTNRRVPTVAEIAEGVRPSTVLVVTEVGGKPTSKGTGWAYDAQAGLLVTNNHVVNGGTSFKVGVGQREFPATLVGTAPCEDLAVLRVSGTTNLKTIALGSQGDLQPGATTVALGYPLNASMLDDLVVAQGVVSVVQTRWTIEAPDVPLYPNLIQTTAAINPGNSGGPLVDDRLRLIGVNSAGISSLQNSNYAIGVDRVKEIVPQLTQGHSIARTGAGFTEYLTKSRLAETRVVNTLASIGLPAQTGIFIASAEPGTSAASGLGELPVLLTKVNGTEVGGSLQGYCRAVGSAREGDAVTFTVYRPGNADPIDVRLTLE